MGEGESQEAGWGKNGLRVWEEELELELGPVFCIGISQEGPGKKSIPDLRKGVS